MKADIYRVVHTYISKYGKPYRCAWDIYARDNQEAQAWDMERRALSAKQGFAFQSAVIMSPKQTRNARRIERLRAERMLLR